MNKKEAETLLILTNFLHDLWQGFKAMVLVGSCIVVIRLALQMLGTMATVGTTTIYCAKVEPDLHYQP